MARRPSTKVHPDDKDKRRQKAICAAFVGGKSCGEIATDHRLTRETVQAMIARAGLSRGDKPSAPKRFSWQDEEGDLPPAL